MEESIGQQYALQVAVQTMKERCLELQRRLSSVEEENMSLRLKQNIRNEDFPSTDVHVLQQKVAQLMKQKSQLTHNIFMVATENRHLWNRLSKIAQTTPNLDHLSKVNDTITQSTSSQTNLIRSKTFTQETPPPKIVRKVESEAFLDTSLEDISLKIINSIAQEKYELEKQCAQMTEMQSEESCLSNSIGFAFPNDELDDCTIEVASNMETLLHIKDTILMQREALKKVFQLMQQYLKDGVLCESCKQSSKKEKLSINIDSGNDETNSNMTVEICSSADSESDKICPVCSKLYIRKSVEEYIKHVQNHFLSDDDMLVENFEVISN